MCIEEEGEAFTQNINIYSFFQSCFRERLLFALWYLRAKRFVLQDDRSSFIIAAEGVDFLMEGAKTANNQEFAALVSDLEARGVTFEICEITLKNRNLKKEQFILGPSFTPSGVVRIANLQSQEHYAYIKP